MTPITIATTGVTGILQQYLPNGLQASWIANVITISGTPTLAGTFPYEFSLGVSCGNPLFVDGKIEVTPATVPDAPTGVVATAGNASASVAFVVPSNNGGSAITGYRVLSDPPFTFSPGNPGNGVGATSPITVSGLTNGTAYTFQVVAINGVGLSNPSAPSAEVTPAPPPSACPTTTVEDRDKNVYNTVGIGTQCWMKENLKVTTYNNGDDIPDETANTNDGFYALTTGARTEYVAAGVTDYVGTYGNLYNWYAAKGIATAGSTTYKNICPTGWHVPTEPEWTTLTDYLGSDAGTFMKKNDALWIPNSGNNSSGFSALPGGLRYGSDGFDGIKNWAEFWSATEGNSQFNHSLYLGLYTSNVGIGGDTKKSGKSIRCLKDSL
jgi:uncharacterized protein (TIGR02145 family)